MWFLMAYDFISKTKKNSTGFLEQYVFYNATDFLLKYYF